MLTCQPAPDCSLVQKSYNYPLAQELVQSAPDTDISGLGVGIHPSSQTHVR